MAAATSPGSGSRTQVDTVVRVARMRPPSSRAVATATGPPFVVSTIRDGSPTVSGGAASPRSASATPPAIVAWPQNGTSASGLK